MSVSSHSLYRLGALEGVPDGTLPHSDLRVGYYDTVLFVHCNNVFCIFQMMAYFDIQYVV
jgi:hypothetical protein